MTDKTQKEKAKDHDSMIALLSQQIESYNKMDNHTPKEVRLGALGVLGLAESFAILSFNTQLLEEIAKVRSKVTASLTPGLESRTKKESKRFRIFYAKRLPVLPFLTPDFFLEGDYHDLGDLEADRLESVYGLLNDPKDKAFLARCEALGTHTALSTGDVVKDASHRYWMCQMQGWKEVLRV